MIYKGIVFTLLTTCGLGLLADEQRCAAADLPDFGEAKIVDGGKVAVTRFIEQKELRTITTPLPRGLKIETRNGTTVGPVSQTVMATVIVTQTDYLDLDKTIGRRINGDPVSTKVLAEELERSTPVIILEEDRAVPLPISKLFAPESLVLVIPPPEAPTLIIPPPKDVR